MKTFFIADTHFGHEAIIRYESRPFKNIDEMDQKLIQNWNSVVGKKDRIFLLGDFSFRGRELSARICNKLNGYKYLVMGNHDSRGIRRYYEMGFSRVYDFPIVLDEFFILSHKPLYTSDNVPYVNIFGHVHGSKTYQDFSEKHFCVSVERINYTPIEISEIRTKIMGVLSNANNCKL